MIEKKNIIIAGAGFGGLAAAVELCKHLKDAERWQVLVVDKSARHIYYPLLYEVASGRISEPMSDNQKLLALSSLEYKFLFKNINPRLVEFVQGEIVEIDRAARQVKLADGRMLSYEYLLGAFGSQTEFFDIDGLRENSFDLKGGVDGLRIRQKIKQCVAAVTNHERVNFNIIIGGGGATGVELAGELAHYFWKLVHQGVLTTGKYGITLVEGSPRLLSMCPPKMSAKVLDRLEHLGVRVLLDTCIKKVDGKNVTVAPRPLRPGESEDVLICDFRGEKEKKLESDIVIWAGGVRAPEIARSLGATNDRKGRVEINEYCQVKDGETFQKNVYAIGDCALFQNEEKQFIPALAQSAVEEAAVAAYNIFSEIYGLGKQRIRIRFYRTIVPVGGKYAIFVGRRYQWYGFMPWLIRELVNLKYFMSIMPFFKAIIYWARGVDVYSKND